MIEEKVVNMKKVLSLLKELRLAKDTSLTKYPFDKEIREVFISYMLNAKKDCSSGTHFKHLPAIAILKKKYEVPLSSKIYDKCGDDTFDFSFLNLAGVNLDLCHPKSACFLGSTFDNSSFVDSCMCFTDFRYSSLKNCDFTHC